MKAAQFYTTDSQGAIPLVLISQTQWTELANTLSSAEHRACSIRQFSGALGEYCLIQNAEGAVTKAFVGSGAGNQEQALAQAALLLPVGAYKLNHGLPQQEAVAWALAQYRFDKYKKVDISPRVLVVDSAELNSLVTLTQSIYLVRDLINTPTSDMGPKAMSLVLRELAQQHDAQFKEWVGDELLRDNFPAIHAVGRASSEEPRLLSLTWGDKQHPLVTLVGKGVCFDTGGLDIKPSQAMRLMKKDMGGAAQVIGLAQWIMTQRIPIHLQVLIPAVENSIGPNAYRPGDILNMRNGLTVEVDNTDAEGRLVLADALVKACEEKPDLLIDFSTLTGAARVAVGTEISALFTNSDTLAASLNQASAEAKDPIWRLPLFSAYEDLLKSNVADMVNSSPSSYAGAIVAALFLQRFVSSSTTWAHFDVMAWNVASKPGKPEGGEAMGLRTIAQYLLTTYVN